MIKNFLIKLFIILIIIIIFIYVALVVISQKKYPVEFGISFSSEYAESLGLDPKEVYRDMLIDLKPKYVRLAVPWSRVETSQDKYSFEKIDYYMNEADKYNVKVVLALGQKVPRWPECYIPEWVKTKSIEDKKNDLLSYIETVVKRYKDHPALEYWQVENEPFIKFEFGECGVFDETSVKSEVDFVRKIDPNHPIIMTDSGELSTWKKAANMGDVLGVTLYRIIRIKGDFIWSYGWLPASVYELRALLWGKNYSNFFISELQAEPWFNGGTPMNTNVSVQEETSSLKQMQENIEFAKRVGASRAYFWGVEWWYWMKSTQNNSLYWDEAKKELSNK